MTDDKVSSSDIIIAVMGPTGAGKSTFINALLREERMTVGHGLSSCTKGVCASTLEFEESFKALPFYKNRRLVIVDTPGFDDTYEGDLHILQQIAEWLEQSYLQKTILGGVIYLHDISSDRFSGTARRNLETFKLMCGDAAMSKVVLGTTKWSRTTNGPNREQELKERHWKTMIEKGSQTCQFLDDYPSAWEFVDVILRRLALANVLEIQRELGIEKKTIPETKAGKELRYTLQEALEMQKKVLEISLVSSQHSRDSFYNTDIDEVRRKLELIAKQIQDLKIPAPRRIRAFLGI
ncbi:hypothetical protein D9613_003469 [Agrocybe pediades]|uniref:G domain-containing protein n=1 Tax=Agrocybe pediades TaxID=84607 RepID=A0A8H4QQI3_9AGAR|nr:hypothetical protein D9613_003469 [Agrocybe pediades]